MTDTKVETVTQTTTETATTTGTDTQTATETVTSTQTATATQTATVTQTATLTATLTTTQTLTATQTATATKSTTQTQSSTETQTATLTQTTVQTQVLTLTESGTLTLTTTGTLTDTSTSSQTQTETTPRTATSTQTAWGARWYVATGTVTGTYTGTRTRTLTSKGTVVATGTGSGTATWSGTYSRTGTATGTGTFTAVLTGTKTLSTLVTITATGTRTQTASKTVTSLGLGFGSKTITQTYTVPSTVTATDTMTETTTLTATNTETVTTPVIVTSTATFVTTEIGTVTNTITNTTTNTLTDTVTNTPTVTNTNTVTNTTTNTVTNTPTVTDTATLTETVTSTVTATATVTTSDTGTASATRTNTEVSTVTNTNTTTDTVTVTNTDTVTNTITVTSTETATDLDGGIDLDGGTIDGEGGDGADGGNLDPCLAAPCQNGGTCTSSAGGYTCSCLEGWTGTNCELSVPVQLLAVGDVGDCNNVAAVTATSLLADQNLGTIALLGDTDQMTGGALSEYMSCFDVPWGRHKSRIRPVPGNHDYMGVGPDGYFAYYGTVAGTPEKTYYSYDLGAWHIVALDDNCASGEMPGGCAAGSAEEQWLRQDLAVHPSVCTLAYFHQARYSSGLHGNTSAASPLYQALLDHGVDVVLSGHDHGYERWVAQDNAGNANADGVVQFVVGTGGTALRSFSSTKPANSAVRDASTHGLLRLTLREEGYDWQFVPIAGGTFTDQGSGSCHVVCPPGYLRNGNTCVDIDECQNNNGGCDPLTTCTNTPGSRTCGPCPAGYIGTGDTTCSLPYIASELVGRPTTSSITINILGDSALEAYFEYGLAPGLYVGTTDSAGLADGILETVIGGLAPDTRYYYRTRYRPSGSADAFLAGVEHSFRTQRAAGSTFTFAVQSDSHQGYAGFYSAALYGITMGNIGGEQPDFLVDLGDTVSTDDATETQTTVRQKYLDQRTVFGLAAHSMPVFLALGNHENEEGWNLDDMGASVQTSLPVLGANARKRYFLNPVPDAFYSGNSDALSALDGDHLREDYYAFTWGDALFVVIDPFWYTMKKPFSGTMGGEKNDEVVGNRWDWTLGDQQYQWLKSTLESSTATFKFVFAHQASGGTDDYIRAGALGAKYCEWGGYNTDGVTWSFESHRPTWDLPIHQLFMRTRVSAFFHGHDHVFAKESLDGIVYQEVPHAANPDYGGGFSSNPTEYAGGVLRNNSGHLRVSVAPTKVTVDYVRSFLPGDGTNGEVAYSYEISPYVARDSDGDGINDTEDGCPSNPSKTARGLCGCGVADTDSDGDGTPDCQDGCPSDPLKTAPGLCGCGYDDALGCPTFIVVRVGDGSAALSSASTAAFVERRRLDTGALITTTALPIAASGANRPLTIGGSNYVEGSLKRTVDGRYVTLAGYGVGPGTANVAQTASATVNRVVARIDSAGTIDTTTALTAAFNGSSGNNANDRAVVSADGSAFYVVGTSSNNTGGIWHVPFGTTTGTQITGQSGNNPGNVRNCNIFNGQLYGLTIASPFYGVFTVGAGLPTAQATATMLPGFPTSGSPAPVDFAILDRDSNVPGADTIYVTDDRALANGGGIQKWTFDGSTWTLAYTLKNGLTTGARHLLVVDAPGSVTLLATTTANPNAIVKFVDAGSTSTATALVTAGTNTAFRGLALSPLP